MSEEPHVCLAVRRAPEHEALEVSVMQRTRMSPKSTGFEEAGVQEVRGR